MRKRPKSKTAEEYQSIYEESQKIIKHLLTVEEPSVETEELIGKWAINLTSQT